MPTPTAIATLALTLAAAAPAPAGAAEPAAAASSPGPAELGLVVGAKAGAGFAQPFGELGTTFVGELEVGYAPPFPDPVGRHLEFLLSGRYAAPGTAGGGPADPRLPRGGALRYDITQRQAVLGLGILYRLALPVRGLGLTAAGGARAYLQRTETTVRAGGRKAPAWEETATDFGPFGALGAELAAGPGAALLELQAGAAALDGRIFRDASAGTLDALLGYRLFL